MRASGEALLRRRLHELCNHSLLLELWRFRGNAQYSPFSCRFVRQLPSVIDMASRDFLDSVERQLSEAIAARRTVSFTLESCVRIAEPHDLGTIHGQQRLFFYQVGGASRSGRPNGWRWADVAKISELRLLDSHFAGSRPAPSGRHHRWQRLIASVSRSASG